MLHDEFEVLALADQLFLVAVLEPRHRAPHAVVVDEGQDVLQIVAMVQVEELGGALRIVAGERVRGDVVDLLVADPDDAPVIQGIEILLAGSQHGRSSRWNLAACRILLVLVRRRTGLAYASAAA